MMTGFDIGQAFTFAFEQTAWRSRFVVLLLLAFIPGMNVIAWTGYSLSVGRAVALQEETWLPTWSDWSDILVRGLLSLAAAVVYFLPAIVIGGSFGIMSLVLGDRAQGTFLAVRFCAFSIAIVYALVTSLLLNAGHANFARTDQFNRSYLNLGGRLHNLRRHTSRLITLTGFQLAVAALGIGILFVGAVVFVVAINLIVRGGVLAALIMIPIMLVVLMLLAAAITLGYLAVGYALGAFAVQLPTKPVTADADSTLRRGELGSTPTPAQ
jgi:hypothetical protein